MSLLGAELITLASRILLREMSSKLIGQKCILAYKMITSTHSGTRLFHHLALSHSLYNFSTTLQHRNSSENATSGLLSDLTQTTTNHSCGNQVNTTAVTYPSHQTMTDSVTLTAAELKLVVLFSKHLETPKVDWEAISKEGEFAHANSARCTWNSLKTKKFNHKPNSRKRK